MRREFTSAVKVARFRHADGRCEGTVNGHRCNVKLTLGKFHYDHDDPDGLTGEPTFENCRCLCVECHKDKTRRDVSNIAKAKRREANHLGARRQSSRPMPGSRNSPWKHKVDGTVVPRERT